MLHGCDFLQGLESEEWRAGLDPARQAVYKRAKAVQDGLRVAVRDAAESHGRLQHGVRGGEHESGGDVRRVDAKSGADDAKGYRVATEGGIAVKGVSVGLQQRRFDVNGCLLSEAAAGLEAGVA